MCFIYELTVKPPTPPSSEKNAIRDNLLLWLANTLHHL